VAAGFVGVIIKYLPADSGVEVPLPQSLSEALDALEKDEVLKEALGEEFVRWFVSIKASHGQ